MEHGAERIEFGIRNVEGGNLRQRAESMESKAQGERHKVKQLVI
jgi:hypothetical protein